MKKLLVWIVALVFVLGSAIDADAQGRGNGHHRKDRKEYAKYQKKRDKAYHKQDKAYYKYAAKQDRSYTRYYEGRDYKYRKYAKQKGMRYRDHDAWYYGKRFHHRSEYVYFPAYRTYYDPYRRGYVYRHNNAWVLAPTLPSFMAGVNLGALNVQFMANIPL